MAQRSCTGMKTILVRWRNGSRFPWTIFRTDGAATIGKRLPGLEGPCKSLTRSKDQPLQARDFRLDRKLLAIGLSRPRQKFPQTRLSSFQADFRFHKRGKICHEAIQFSMQSERGGMGVIPSIPQSQIEFVSLHPVLRPRSRRASADASDGLNRLPI